MKIYLFAMCLGALIIENLCLESPAAPIESTDPVQARFSQLVDSIAKTVTDLTDGKTKFAARIESIPKDNNFVLDTQTPKQQTDVLEKKGACNVHYARCVDAEILKITRLQQAGQKIVDDAAKVLLKLSETITGTIKETDKTPQNVDKCSAPIYNNCLKELKRFEQKPGAKGKVAPPPAPIKAPATVPKTTVPASVPAPAPAPLSVAPSVVAPSVVAPETSVNPVAGDDAAAEITA